MEKDNKFLSEFKRTLGKRIATTPNAYEDNSWSYRRVTRVKDYSLEEVKKIIESGSLEEQQKLSRNYFYKDGFYKRLIIYYATILKYSGVLIANPSFGKNLSQEHIQKRYHSALDFIERAKLPSLLTNCSYRALVDGSYYGLLLSADKNSLCILDLPVGYCSSNFKDIHGNDIIQFDVSYFDTIFDKAARQEALDVYPDFISNAYRKYKKGKAKKIVMIPSDVGICFPFFDGRPIFLDVIPAAIEYDMAVDTERERDLDEIRKIIVQKVPHLNDGTLLFEPEEAEEMHMAAVGMLRGNKNISVLTTYDDVDAIVSKTSGETTTNRLEKMVQNIYDQAGASKELFAASGSSSLDKSIKNDTALMMVLGNKYSDFLTNLINMLYANSNVNFKYTILPITWYNEKEYVEESFKLAGMGYSFLIPSMALGLTQRDLVNIKMLENDVLKLDEILIPLQTAYTQTAESAGRPVKEGTEQSPKTIKNKESQEKTGQGGSK